MTYTYKRSRTIVISGVAEPPPNLRASERALDLNKKLDDIFDVLNIDCCATEAYRVGKPNQNRPRLVKVVLPSRFYWRLALSNARLLNSSGFSDIYIRRSMTEEERRKEYELRQEARERNRDCAGREWVVYKGRLTHISELPRKSSVNQ